MSFKKLNVVEIDGIKYREMKQKDIAVLREQLWIKNGKKCPVLGLEIPLKDTALDHAHKRVDESYAPDKGVIRETLDFRVNAILGKLENSIKRTGLHNMDVDIPNLLRRAADYFESGAYVDEDGFMYVHPKEVPKEQHVSKRNYNKLKKVYTESKKKAKFPEYPKSKKLTKKLKELFEEFNIEPYN